MDERGLYRPFVNFALILTGSVITLTIMTWGSDSLWLASSGNIVGIVLAILLAITGFSTGIWMLIGSAWRYHPRRVRLDLAFVYLAIGWLGGHIFLRDAPGLPLCMAGGVAIVIAYLMLRPFPALRRWVKDEDLFP